MKQGTVLTLFGTILLLFSSSPLMAVTEVSPGFFQGFVWFITSPVVSGILVAIGLSCILLELMTTGFGIFGVTGLVVFFLYFAGHIMLDSFAWLGLILFAAGMLFLMLEAFVLTGFGISGLLGIVAIIGSVILLSPSVGSGVLTVTIAFVLTILIMVVCFRFMKKKKFIHRFILSDRTDAESGYTAPNMDNDKYLGKEGVTLTKLRPAGEMRIGNDRVDVVSEGDFIDAGVKVRVIAIDGTRNIVRVVD